MIILNAADAAALAEVHASSMQSPWSAEEFARLLASPGCVALGKLVGEALGGFVLLRAAADEAEILTLAVIPACRSEGVGMALVEAAIGEAGRRGAATMFLEVAENNAPALALYARAGFAAVSRRARYYGGKTDAMVLRRAVDGRCVAV
ncbi:MAG: ribosomal protein S18-alanine N-acetyltransferase [Alphaproteobacteria bacterium]|nr:ribosomal protein S18-alanine N-acetyltransferase [Alphaproteobacteria bacterium]